MRDEQVVMLTTARRARAAVFACLLLSTTVVVATAQVSVVHADQPEVVLTSKSVDPTSTSGTPLRPGDTVTYTISYYCSGLNLGDHCGDSVLSDPLPQFTDIYGNTNQLEFVSASFLTQNDWTFDGISGAAPNLTASWTAVVPDNNCTTTLGANVGLCAGDSGAIILELRVPNGIVPYLGTPQVVTNSATVDQGPTPDGNPEGTPVTAVSHINGLPADSTISKSGPADLLLKAAGTDQFDYTISICPEPDSPLYPAYTVTDTLPEGFTFASATPSPTSVAPGLLTWEIDELNLPPRNTSTGCLSITVTGSFVNADNGGDPSNVFDAEKTNTASATGHPSVGVDVGVGTANTTLTLRRPITSFGVSKNTGGNYYVDNASPDNVVHYFLGANNTSEVGAAPFSDATILDGPLPAQFTLDTIHTGTWTGSGDGSVTAVIQTSPDGSSWTTVSSTAGQSISVAPGVVWVRWVFSSTPAAMGPGWSASGQELIGVISGSVGDTLTNCAGLTGLQEGVLGEQDRGNSCANVLIETPKPHPSISKSAPTRLEPGQTITYTLVAENNIDATDVLTDPQITDCVPDSAHLTVSNLLAGGSALPSNGWSLESFTPLGCDGATGTLVQVQYTGTLAPGEAAPSITYDVTADAFGDVPGPTPPGNYTNTATVTYSDGSPFDHCVQTSCAASHSVQVPVIAQLQSEKLVKGALDREFNKAGTTTPGGQVTWRLKVQNVGNVQVENTQIVDVFSFVGDRGVQVATKRGSEYVPYLVEPISVPLDWVVEYSTSNNPCRPEVLGPNTSCDPANWTTTPDLSALSTYKSIRLTYLGRIGIGEEITFDYDQVTPVFDASYDTPDTSSDPWDVLDDCTIPNSQHPWQPLDAINNPGDSTLDTVRTEVSAWSDSNHDGVQQSFEGGPTCPRASNSFAYGVDVPDDQRNGLPDPGRLGAEPPKVDLHVAGPSLLNAIGNRVWEDWDHDGIQDSVLTEPGIADVRVELYDGGGLVDTTFTDTAGWYMFDSLPYRTDYFVRFYMPDEFGYVTLQDSTGVAADVDAANTDDDSDVPSTLSGTNAIGNYYDTTTVTLGEVGAELTETDPTWDAGIWIPHPAISLLKSVNGQPADSAPGVYIERDDAVTWNYVITNTGNTTLRNVTLTDHVDAGGEPDPTPVCPWGGNTGHVLARGESITCTASSTAIVGQYTNTATVVGTPTLEDGTTDIVKTGVPTSVSDSNPANYFGVEYDLALAKVTSGVNADGVTVSWTIRVVNQGNVASGAFTVTDVVPAGLYVTSASPAATTNSRPLSTPPDPTLTPPTTTLTWTLGSLAPGQTTDITINTRISDVRLRPFRNWAEISSDSATNYGATISDWDSTPNSNVGLDDVAGAGTSPDDLVEDVTSLTNIPDNSVTDEDDNDYAEVNPLLVYDLALAKIVTSGASATDGSTITWRFRVYNQGNVPSGAAVFTDNLPTGLDFVSATMTRSTVSGGGTVASACSLDGNGYTLTCNAPTFAAGDYLQVVITTTIAGSPYDDLSTAPWRNWAEVSDDGSEDYDAFNGSTVDDRDSTPDTDIAHDGGTQNDAYVSITSAGNTYTGAIGDEDDNDDAVVTNSGVYDLALSKVVDDSFITYDQTVTFTITVDNQGTLPSHGYTITDHVPAGMDPVLPLATGTWDSLNRTITWTMPNLLPADTPVTRTYQATISDINQRPFRNHAEISADSAGDWNIADIDSDPLVTENDAADYPAIGAAAGTGIDNTNISQAGSDGAGDEDDEDIADVNVDVVYDLALVKVVDATSLVVDGLYTGTATYTITVQNQGTVPSHDFVVSDIVPLGLTPVEPIPNGGSYNAGTRTITWTVLDLLPNATTTLTFDVHVTDFNERPYRNVARITADSAVDYGVTDADSNPSVIDDTNGEFPSIGSPAGTGFDNLVIGDAGHDGTGETDDEDIADIGDQVRYDLALVKVNDGAAVVNYDDTVSFTITVQNQGDVDSREFDVTDTLPDGLSVVNAGGGTTGVDGGGHTTLMWTVANLTPGQTTTFTFTVSISDITKRPFRNHAAITRDSAATYDSPLIATHDADSDPSVITDGPAAYPTVGASPGTGIDNLLIGEAGNDNDTDDEDIADVDVDVVYDLALAKVASTPANAYSTVTFTITVTNQGTVPSGTYQVTDRLPGGMHATAASDGGDFATTPGRVVWNLSGADMLDPGESLVLTITTVIDDLTQRPFKNIAEISQDSADSYSTGSVTVTDVDSTPDATVDNDNSGFGNGADGYGTAEHPTNDVASTGGAEGPDAGGEDDADVAYVDISVLYDLALVKTGPANFDGASAASFTIQVLNQGNVNSGTYVVRDTIPAGLIATTASNSGVISVSGDTVTWTLSGLAPSASISLVVTVVITDFSTRPWVNRAEITSDGADDYDTLGYELASTGDVEDDDSVPDSLSDNDLLIDQTVLPAVQDNTGSGDEDDSDVAPIGASIVYDLSLVKILPTGQKYKLNGDIFYDIQVMNQGNVNSGSITVIDDLPTGLTFVSADHGGTASGQRVTWTIANLVPAQIVTLRLTAKLTNTKQTSYINRAEISSDGADQYDVMAGNVLVEDVEDKDSLANTNLLDDQMVNTDDVTLDHLTGDEDDQDVAALTPSEVSAVNALAATGSSLSLVGWAVWLLAAGSVALGASRRRVGRGQPDVAG